MNEKTPSQGKISSNTEKKEDNSNTITSNKKVSLDDFIAENFVLLNIAGKGAFGEIYLSYSLRDSIEVAIKKEKKIPQKHSQLYMEGKVYQSLLNINSKQDLSGAVCLPQDNVQGVAKFYGVGELAEFNYLIIDFLGPNLIELFNFCKVHKFTTSCICLLAIQILNRIENLHEHQFIHRDIKPENFVIGTEEKTNIIYLIDFGLAKRYKNPKNNQHIPYRENRPLTGTARYVSINTHLGIEQSRRDDLESIGYMFVFFFKGSLPWKGLKGGGGNKYQRIMEKKLQIPTEILCYGLPEEMVHYLNYCKGMRFEDKPDYDYLRGLFIKLLTSCSSQYGLTKEMLKFDWCFEDPLNSIWKVYKRGESMVSNNNTNNVYSSPNGFLSKREQSNGSVEKFELNLRESARKLNRKLTKIDETPTGDNRQTQITNENYQKGTLTSQNNHEPFVKTDGNNPNYSPGSSYNTSKNEETKNEVENQVNSSNISVTSSLSDETVVQDFNSQAKIGETILAKAFENFEVKEDIDSVLSKIVRGAEEKKEKSKCAEEDDNSTIKDEENTAFERFKTKAKSKFLSTKKDSSSSKDSGRKNQSFSPIDEEIFIKEDPDASVQATETEKDDYVETEKNQCTETEHRSNIIGEKNSNIKLKDSIELKSNHASMSPAGTNNSLLKKSNKFALTSNALPFTQLSLNRIKVLKNVEQEQKKNKDTNSDDSSSSSGIATKNPTLLSNTFKNSKIGLSQKEQNALNQIRFNRLHLSPVKGSRSTKYPTMMITDPLKQKDISDKIQSLKGQKMQSFENQIIPKLTNEIKERRRSKILDMAPIIQTASPGPQEPAIDMKFSKEKLIPINKEPISKYYKVYNDLGCGSYGHVKKVRCLKLHENRAMKVVSKKTQSSQNEIDILRKISHPNIVNIYEIFEDSKKFYIMMELVEGGELFDAIALQGYLGERNACIVMRQILKAVNYLHSNDIVHRDLKPENILLLKRGMFNAIKLIDFGTAKQMEKGKKLTKFIGTSYYLAPEVIKESYDEKCDIWSCGVILYILLCGYPPFNGSHNHEIYHNIQMTEPTFTGDEWSDISANAISLIKSMLEKNPSKRFSASMALNHPWFRDYDDGSPTANACRKQMNAVKKMSKFIYENKLKQAVMQFIITQFDLKKEEENLREVFKQFDADKKGMITKEVFLGQLVKLYGENEAKILADKIFNTLDLDGSGEISYNEFLTAMMDDAKVVTNDRMECAFKMFDRDGNGKLSIDEIRTAFGGDERTWRKVIKDIDKNNDGEVDFEEFKNLMLGLNSQLLLDK